MYTWQERLNGDPLPWLLEPQDPSVRYWALVALLDRPADDPDVQATRAAIAQQPLVQQLFALQHPEGHWGDDASQPYTAQGTMGVLPLLYMFGVIPDERTAAGCDSCLKNCQHESGGFSMVRRTRSGIIPCSTGNYLPLLVYFGLGDDPCVRAAFAYLVESMSAEDALVCGRYNHQPCLWGAIAALKGLAILPAEMRSAQSEGVVRRLANTLLDAPYDFSGEHKRWLTFGVPRAWDLLSASRVLAQHGYAHDPRFAPLLALVLERQDGQGRWVCGSTSRTWAVARRNQPDKWVTLDALWVLKQAA